MTDQQEKLSRQWLLEYYAMANNHFHRIFPRALLFFSLHSKLYVGLADLNVNQIKLNKNLWSFGGKLVKETIGHEVAHQIVSKHYGGVYKYHGPEWIEIMGLFGLSPDEEYRLNRPLSETEVWYCPCKKHYLPTETVKAIKEDGLAITCSDCNGLIERGKSK